MKMLISACLLGLSCRYDGASKPLEAGVIERLKAKFDLVPVCPEILGGLETPRPPAEIQGGRVVNALGRDVTENYRRGAMETLRLARTLDCGAALLKERSPSCGSEWVYDGSFSGALTRGDGVTARLLKENGIAVFGESGAEELLKNI